MKRIPDDKLVPAARDAWEDQLGKDMGGGVFINVTARMPVDRNKVRRAEYDPGAGRFILDDRNGKILLPPMDADMTATVIKCLYDGEEGRREISESFNIDPNTLERYRGKRSVGSYESPNTVLLGCKYLWDTRAGQLLINADDLLCRITAGKNREGRDLTKDYGWASLFQMTLDHPFTKSVVTPPGSGRPNYDARFWIAPNEIRLRRSGDELKFEDISFRFFTETIRFDSRQYFRGAPVPNPGADSFSVYFNRNFERFSGLILKGEMMGRPVRPLEELKELARIVSAVRWIRGVDGGNQIPMDISWARGRATKRYVTPFEIEAFSREGFDNMVRDMRLPVTIYNEYGISRILYASDKRDLYEYDRTGQLRKITRVESNRETVILDVWRTNR
jgi:hypothetical protein